MRGIRLLVLFLGLLSPTAAKSLPSHDNLPTLTPSDSGGWVNPEHLPPMPQCIAQQDDSLWLRALTDCTGRRCTRHFGVICTHHQWLTEIACLRTRFCPDLIKEYMPLCSRSILAKAQLSQWVFAVTGRTWLAKLGDTIDVQRLSPTSLAKGCASVDVINKAPACLTQSSSALTNEAFDHAIATCGLTSRTEHTGNAGRPWEYNERLHSMIALDYETVGYNLTHSRQGIAHGHYFDKECFCNAFSLPSRDTNCSGLDDLDFTKEQIWMNATCGPTSLSSGATHRLQTTGFAYIPVEDWRWPKCILDMPKNVTELQHRCTGQACEVDSDGYCSVRSAIDRACFCKSMTYDSSYGSCQFFEYRIDYTKWIRNTCDNVDSWQGPPRPWAEMLAPTSIEMLPWQWTVESECPADGTERCLSKNWKFGSLFILNAAAYIAVHMGRRLKTSCHWRELPWEIHEVHSVYAAVLLAALQLIATWLNAIIVHSTHGYNHVSVAHLVLFWCTMPRSVWLFQLLKIARDHSGAMSFGPVISSLVSEFLIQTLSLYYMTTTVQYGFQHSFYFGRLNNVKNAGAATIMYTGALLWLVVFLTALVQLIKTWRQRNTYDKIHDPFKRITHYIGYLLNNRTKRYIRPPLREADQRKLSERTTLLSNSQSSYSTWQASTSQALDKEELHPKHLELYVALACTVSLLWVAQWLVWWGYIVLSSKHYCPPYLSILVLIWIMGLLIGNGMGL